MSALATVALRARVLELAREYNEDVQAIVTEFVAASLASASEDEAHLEGIEFARSLETHLLATLVH